MTKNSNSSSNKSTTKSTSTTSSSSGKNVPHLFKPSEVNPKLFDIKNGVVGKMQDIRFINYMNPKTKKMDNVYVVTQKIKIVDGGMPSKTTAADDYNHYETDDKRAFIKVPLDRDQESCNDLRKLMEKVDAWGASPATAKTLFAEHADKYEYVPCISVPVVSTDKKESKYPKHDKVKMRLHIGTGEDKNTNYTAIVRLEEETKIVDGVEKKVVKSKTPIDADTIQKVGEHITFLSEIRFVFKFLKIWIAKSAKGRNGIKEFGISFRLIKVEYVPGLNKKADNPDDFDIGDEDDEILASTARFDDDEEADADAEGEDSEDAPTTPTKSSKSKPKAGHPTKGDDNSDEEDASPAPPSKKTSRSNKKGVAKDDDASEPEPSEEAIPVKKSSRKHTRSEPSEEDNVEDVPIKKSSRSKHSTKNNDSAEEDEDVPIKSSRTKSSRKPVADDEDEDETPIVKSKNTKPRVSSRK